MEPGKPVKLNRALGGWILLLATSALLAGCQTKSIYYGGHYEGVVYAIYNQPDKSSPEQLAAIMEQDEQKAASLNKPLLPGFHAQLGYLYAQMGKTDQARQEYEKEKQQFPESAVFMDRLLGNPVKK